MGHTQSRASNARSNPLPPGFSFPPGHMDVWRYYFTPLYYVEELKPHGISVERCATIQEYTLVPGPTLKIRWGAKKMVITEKGKETLIDLISPPASEKEGTESRSCFGRFVDYCTTIQESVISHDNSLLNKHRAPDNFYDNIACQRMAMSRLEDGDVQPVALGEYSAEAGSTQALAEIAGKNMKRNKEPLEHSTLVMRIAAVVTITLGLFKGLFIRRKGLFKSLVNRPKGLKVTFSDEVTVHECIVHDSKLKKGVRFAEELQDESCPVRKQDGSHHVIADAESNRADPSTSISSDRSLALMDALECRQIDSNLVVAKKPFAPGPVCVATHADCKLFLRWPPILSAATVGLWFSS